MIIFKDIVSGDELFTDAFEFTREGSFFRVPGKMTTESASGIDESLIGGNASQEEKAETTEDSAVSGIDVVLNNRLVPTSFSTKKEFQVYFKEYLKTLESKINERGLPFNKEQFQKNMLEGFKEACKSFKEWEYYLGESADPEASVVLCKWENEPEVPVFYFFIESIVEEKV